MNSHVIITDSLWSEIGKVIPTKNTKVGRPEWCPRKTLEGVFFILHTGCQWFTLPPHYGNSKTIHGKFMKWCKAGIFDQIQNIAVLYYLNEKNICPTWFAIDASHRKAPFASWSGRTPTDRAKRGVKISLITDWFGAPLSFVLDASNRHDSKQFLSTLDSLRLPNPEITKIIAADSAYDSKHLKNESKRRNYVLLAATNKRRNKNREDYKPSGRWVIERTFGWISWHRGLKTCWCKTKKTFHALVSFALSIQLFRMGGIYR